MTSVSELDILAEVKKHVASKVEEALKLCRDYKGRCIFPTQSISLPDAKISDACDPKMVSVADWMYRWITVIVTTLNLGILVLVDEVKLLGDLDWLSASGAFPEYLLVILKLGRQRLVDTIVEANNRFILQRTSILYFDKILALFYIVGFDLLVASDVFSNFKHNGISVCSPAKRVCFEIHVQEGNVVRQWITAAYVEIKRMGYSSRWSFQQCLDKLPCSQSKDKLLVPKFAYSALFKVVAKPAKLLLENINDIAYKLIPVSSWEELAAAIANLTSMLENGGINDKQFIELYTGCMLVILRTLFPTRYSTIYNVKSANMLDLDNMIGEVIVTAMENHKYGQAKTTRGSNTPDDCEEFPFVLPIQAAAFLSVYVDMTHVILLQRGLTRSEFLVVTGDGCKADYAYCERVYAKCLKKCFGITDKLGNANAWRKYNDHLVAVVRLMHQSPVLDSLFIESSEYMTLKHYAGHTHMRVGALLRFMILMKAISKEFRQAGKANAIFESLAAIDANKLVRDLLENKNCNFAVRE